MANTGYHRKHAIRLLKHGPPARRPTPRRPRRSPYRDPEVLVKKRYDPARTPYQRVLAAPEVAEEAKATLRETYWTLNPVSLRQQIDEHLDRI